MANGYLYLRCIDCQGLLIPPKDADFTLFRDFENLNGHGRWSKETLEAWLKKHVEGNCRGSLEANDGYENVIKANRIIALDESI